MSTVIAVDTLSPLPIARTLASVETPTPPYMLEFLLTIHHSSDLIPPRLSLNLRS